MIRPTCRNVRTALPKACPVHAPRRGLTSRTIVTDDKNLVPIRTNLRGSSLLNTPRVSSPPARQGASCRSC